MFISYWANENLLDQSEEAINKNWAMASQNQGGVRAIRFLWIYLKTPIAQLNGIQYNQVSGIGLSVARPGIQGRKSNRLGERHTKRKRNSVRRRKNAQLCKRLNILHDRCNQSTGRTKVMRRSRLTFTEERPNDDRLQVSYINVKTKTHDQRTENQCCHLKASFRKQPKMK